MAWAAIVAVAALLAALGSPVRAAALNAAAIAPLPFQYSKDFDLYNQAEAVKYFEEKFYQGNRAELSDEQLQQVDGLRQLAFQEPALALAAAQVLYMFGWFRTTGEIIRSNVVAAAQLFERSIPAGGCGSGADAGRLRPVDVDWVENACDIRWMHSMLLYSWLGETEGDAAQSESYTSKAYEMLHSLREAPKYAHVGQAWVSPLHLNFNAVKFPGKPSHAIWDTSKVPIGRFLEEYHPVFKAELQAILDDPRDLYNQLMKMDPSREHLATPGGWDTVRIVRYHHWYSLFCQMAPRTCELVASRQEIANCSFMNVNYVRLNPGAHLKPHFGNGPRLSAHLSIIAPEPLRAGMSVGTDRTLWIEGKAVIFDDTYPHCVSHWGSLPRYVMLVWFCHPCDQSNPHGQSCPGDASEPISYTPAS